MSFSPDGKYLATGNESAIIRVRTSLRSPVSSALLQTSRYGTLQGSMLAMSSDMRGGSVASISHPTVVSLSHVHMTAKFVSGLCEMAHPGCFWIPKRDTIHLD